MKRTLACIMIALAAVGLLGAQGAAGAAGAQKLILAFVSGNDLTIIGPDKSTMKYGVGIFEDDPIPVGSTITTGPSTTAELKLTPNGSIVKLGKATSFAVSALANQPQDKNAFSVAAGKVRAVAAKGGQYEVKTQTAVCGVRGTDFAVAVEPGKKDMLAVAKGLVEFQKVDAAGAVLAALPVAAGQAADAFSPVFQTFAFDMAKFSEEFAETVFEKLNDQEVNQEEAPAQPVAAAEKKPEPAPAAPPVPEPTTAAEAAKTVAEGVGKMSKDEVESGLMKWLREALGMEIGSVTIGDTTFSKAVIQPNINLGKFKLGLYLPIIYTSDMFDPNDWYHPNGNDEWSFGMGLWETDPIEAAKDAAEDLALKIKYIELGRQLVDPFFIKVGNLDSLTIGHGLIMRNYANNTEFPAIRKVGFNLGIDAKAVGFEALVNDLANPEILGARFFIRPVPKSKIAIGFSGAVDLYPASDLYDKDSSGNVVDKSAAEALGDPMFVTGGVDLDLPIRLIGGRFFADAAAALPWTRTAISGGPDAGLQMDVVWDGENLQNWGAATGFMGRLIFIDWRLEYRYYTGIFKPAFFDTTYNKTRVSTAQLYKDYLVDPTAFGDAPTIMGVYGEGGFSLLKEKLKFEVGYAWPIPPGTSPDKLLEATNDELHASLVIQKGLIPIIDVAGAIRYDKRGIVKSIVDGDFKLIDEKTTFGGEVLVPVPKSPNLDIAVVFATVAVRDGSGNVQWKDEAKGIPELKPSVSIETRFHF